MSERVVAGHTGHYRGCIRVAGKVVWTCDHHHRNRDLGSPVFGPSARGCAMQVLRYVTSPEMVAIMDDYFRANRAATQAEHEAHRYAKSVAPRVRAIVGGDV